MVIHVILICCINVQVDQKNESLLVPIYGLMVPFHILTVKNVSNNQVSVLCLQKAIIMSCHLATGNQSYSSREPATIFMYREICTEIERDDDNTFLVLKPAGLRTKQSTHRI